jgi:hypothetical protein
MQTVTNFLQKQHIVGGNRVSLVKMDVFYAFSSQKSVAKNFYSENRDFIAKFSFFIAKITFL